MVDVLEEEDVEGMSLTSLVQRMDEVRQRAQQERYGDLAAATGFPPLPLVRDIMKTSRVAAMDDTTARGVAYCAFRYLLQQDLLSVGLGIANRELFGPDYDEARWRSPLFRMRAAMLDQYGIVASRIALECFFQLLHMVWTGTEMRGRSKFGAFRKWVLEEGNPFVYFIGLVIDAHEYDRKHRTGEVHGTSKFAKSLLTLATPDSSDLDVPVRLTGALLSTWEPVIQILNGEEPATIAVFASSSEFGAKYFSRTSDPAEFRRYITKLTSELLA